jgi:hypothetical protein
MPNGAVLSSFCGDRTWLLSMVSSFLLVPDFQNIPRDPPEFIRGE